MTVEEHGRGSCQRAGARPPNARAATRLATCGAISRVDRPVHQAAAYYDRLSGWYDRLSGWSEQPHVERGLRALAAAQGEDILEIGCGTGRALAAIARATAPDGTAHGIDISQGMVRRTRDRTRRPDHAQAPGVVVADGRYVPYGANSFDGVFMSFVLDLVDTPELGAVLGECRRVLRPSGRLCVVVLSRDRDLSAVGRLYEQVHALFPVLVDCRPIPVSALLPKAGFRVAVTHHGSMWGIPVIVALGIKECD